MSVITENKYTKLQVLKKIKELDDSIAICIDNNIDYTDLTAMKNRWLARLSEY